MVTQQGIAQGTALKNVSAENDQDLMFMAGERVVLLERLGGGICMGYCEGVVGRFQESTVDFSSCESTATAEPAAVPATASKNRSRASSPAPIPDKHILSKEAEVNSVFSVLSRHSLMTALALDPEATARPGPRKLLSEENLQVTLGSGSTQSGLTQQHSHHNQQVQTPALIASMALHPENIQHSSAPVIPPRSSSRQSNKKATRPAKRSSGVASLATKSSTSSMSSSTVDQSASATEGEFNGDQSRLSPIPPRQQQRSASSSASDSVASSRATSPVTVDKETPTRISRPVTPILHGNGLGQQPPTSKSKAHYNRRQSLESPHSQRLSELEREQRLNQEHDHYLSSVLEDIRSKTHHVLQKAGFSMAPNAGLYADRGSKEDDLATVVQMPSTTSTTVAEVPQAEIAESTAAGLAAVTKVTVQTAISASAQETQENESNEPLANGVSFAISTASPTPKNNNSAGFWGRPRSRSLFRDENPGTSIAQIAQSSSLSDTAVTDVSLEATATTTAPSFMSGLEKLKPWSRLGQRQRSNSGPVRYADAARLEDDETGDCRVPEMESAQVVAVEAASGTAAAIAVPSQLPHQVEIKKAPSLRQRRVSEGTAITVNSLGSTQSCQPAPAPGMTIAATIAEQRAQANASKHRSKNWFGIAKRTSGYVEDTRKPHQLGHGIEGGIVSRHLSALMADGEDDEEDENEFEEEEEDCEGRKSGENARIYVNDFGFIYDLDDEMNQGQDLTGTGSAVGVESGLMSNASTVSGIERKRADRRHKFIRENELKWMHAITQMPADNVKKSTKYKKLVRRGVPTSVRGRVWLFLAKADVYRRPGLFDELMKRGPLPIHEVIERDIHRCYPDHIHFRDGMGGTGQQDLHSVLKAYAHYKPSVGYCQGMGRLVGMMLMQMPVEDAFWLLVATIENYMQDYYTPTLRQLRIDAQVFERLLKDQDPALADHLERNDVIPLMYMTQWFMTLFTMSLPWASVLRVWDVFYYDGVKALFRVGLAILQLCREHLLTKCPSSSELLAFILHIPLDLLGPKAVLDAALNIKLRKQSVQRLIAVTAETMDAAAKAKQQPTTEASPPPSAPSAAASTTTAPATAPSESGTSAPADNSSSTTTHPTTNNNTDTQPASPASASSSSISVSASSPPSAASSPPSTVPSTAASSRPISQTSSSSPISMPSASAPSSFSPLGVFKARRRAGTVHH
ncbi:hypothetical protein BGZ72_000711 [Mortierella alpina]|nr:hypothetical protein BGZ72_000711 [Mortierella alpina]